MLKNNEISKILYEISELLALAGENRFRILAYERAARTVENFAGDIEDIAAQGKLREIPGIGEGMAEKISEYLKDGRLKYLDELKKKFPEGLLEMMAVPGLGPRKAKIIFGKLKISNLKELRLAAKHARLRGLPGFGEKTEANILKGIQLKENARGRILLPEALKAAGEITAQLKKGGDIIEIQPAGSLRRRKETIGDIDILCIVQKGKEKSVIDKFTHLPGVIKINAAGETKASVVSESGLQADLRVIEQASYGAALQYFTGSKEHNIAMRELAKKKGLTINEYGVSKLDNKSNIIAGRTEKDVYASVGLAFIEPELRENRGEIKAAQKNALPKLIELKDIRGDTHAHSNYSDGSEPVSVIAEKAAEAGYEWIIITDHSQSLKIARGLTVKELMRKLEDIKKINLKQKKIKVLFGAEVDILMDGSLDYTDEVLNKLDFVTASIHSGFKQPQEKIHERIFRAFENKYVHCLSHPTGRLIGTREAYAVNMEKVIAQAAKTGVYLEINAYPERMDIYDIHCKMAKEAGVKIAIGTDAHHTDQLAYMELGVCVARRGWLEKSDVINTLSFDKLVKALGTRR